jgi:hypothetical protein
MARMRFDYVREWVDKKTGHVYRQFRRRGYKRIMLKGLPGSVEFRLAYEAALDGPAITIGAKRTRPGTVNAAIAAYYSSLEFRSLAPATQAMRRAVLERFRIDHGDRYIAELPGKFVLLSLAALGPFAARNWLKALRGLVRFAVTQGMCERDPTHGIRLPKVLRATDITPGPRARSRPSGPHIRSARWRALRSRSRTTPPCVVATSSAWGASISATGSFTSHNRRNRAARHSCLRSSPSCKPPSTR